MKKALITFILAAASTGQADFNDCDSEYNSQLTYLSEASSKEGFRDSALFINKLLSNIPNDVYETKMSKNELLSTTGATTTTTIDIPATTTTPTSIALNNMDPKSRYRETKFVFDLLDEMQFSSDGGLKLRQFYIQLKGLGYSKSLEEMRDRISLLNSSKELCSSEREYVMTASELALLLLNDK